MVLDATREQHPVQPEAVRARLEAGDDADRRAKPRLGACSLPRNEAQDVCDIARSDAVHHDLLRARQARRDPARPAELQGEVDGRVDRIEAWRRQLLCARTPPSGAVPSLIASGTRPRFTSLARSFDADRPCGVKR
jgi:hypothetical protein